MVAQLHLLKPVKCFTLSLPAPALLLWAQRVMSMLQYCVCVFHDYLITVNVDLPFNKKSHSRVLVNELIFMLYTSEMEQMNVN